MSDTADNEQATSKPLMIDRHAGESEDQAMARTLADPCTRHGVGSLQFVSGMMGGAAPLPGPTEMVEQVKAFSEGASNGNLDGISRMLAAQAVALDTMFSELARRAALNLGSYPDAVDRYARLALKAQANARATLEALAKLHQPREQIVRHVHVNEGGQAIVADQFNNYAKGGKNAESDEQCHAAGKLGQGSSLRCADTEGNSLPVASSVRQEALSNARRHKSRRSQR